MVPRDFPIPAGPLALARLCRGRMAASAGLSALCAAAEGAGLVMLLPLLAAAGLTGAAPTPPLLAALAGRLGLAGLLAGWLALVAAQTGLGMVRDRQVAALHVDGAHRLRLGLVDAVVAMEWAAFQRERVSDIVSAATVAAGRVAQGLSGLSQLLSRGLFMLAQAAVALWLSPAAAALALAAGLGLAALQLPRLRLARRHGQAAAERTRGLHSVLTDHLGAMKLAKAHAAEAAFTAALAGELAAAAEAGLAVQAAHAQSRATLRLGAAAVTAAVTWVAAARLGLHGPELLVLLAVFARLMPGMGEMANSAQQVAEMLPAFAQIETLRARCRAAAEPVAGPQSGPLRGPLVLDGVHFAWPGRRAPAVDGIDLVVPEATTVALVGPSGAGKSTLADLALGVLVPDRGTVRVGGVALDGPARAAWRHRVAYVPQDVFLFHDSVRANLLWARPDSDETALWRVLEMAAAAELVRGLPQGLETVVGDRGTRLSGGERQRLALARALLRRPAFLVLDEATSALDRESERLVQDALAVLRGTVTVLVIAHRLSTVRAADLVMVIERGRVTDQGGWDELAGRRGGWLHGVLAQDDGA